jgi:hypothetical protein
MDFLVINGSLIFPPISAAVDKVFIGSILAFLYKFLHHDSAPVRNKTCELLKCIMFYKGLAFDQVLQMKMANGELVDLSKGFLYVLEPARSDAIHPFINFQSWLSTLEHNVIGAFSDEWNRTWNEQEINNIENVKKMWANTHKYWAERSEINIKSDTVTRSILRTAEAERKQSIRRIQEPELTRHLAWTQERFDRLKFGSRTYHHLVSKVDDFLLSKERDGDWCLDFTEGPCRMRKKLWRLHGTHLSFTSKGFKASYGDNGSAPLLSDISSVNKEKESAKVASEDEEVVKKLDFDKGSIKDLESVEEESSSKSFKSPNDIQALRGAEETDADDKGEKESEPGTPIPAGGELEGDASEDEDDLLQVSVYMYT